jgi:anti-anti-sigma factor
MPLFAATRETDLEGQDVLVVTGDVDLATAHELVAAADGLASSGGARLLRLDLAGVTFLDSTGISALLEIRRAAARSGADVVVVGRSPIVDRVFSLAGIADLFAPEGV